MRLEFTLKEQNYIETKFPKNTLSDYEKDKSLEFFKFFLGKTRIIGY